MSLKAGLFAATLASAASPLAMAAVIEGTVTEATGDVALEGAIVSIDQTGQSTRTARDGSFRFADVPAGDYSLTVSYLGADDATSTISVTDDAPARIAFAIGEDIRLLDNVLVTGQRGSFFAARNRERSSDSLISVLSSDAIGSLPDQNVAESVRRVAGVSVQNDQGEGRFVVIRGLDPSLNATSINGVRLPAPEAGTRAVALDVIDSDALDSITIQKSLTPDLDGDGIGGSINIETLSAFDRNGRYLLAKAEGIYSDGVGNWGEKIGLTASDRFLGGDLGIAGNITWNRRDFGSENKEAGEWIGGDGLAIFPEEYELRNYDIVRERLSATLNVDYQLNGSTQLYVRTLYNEFSDQEYRNSVTFALDDAEQIEAALPGVATFAEGDGLEVERALKDRLETQQIWSVQTGGETIVDAITLDYSLAYSHSEEDEDDAVDPFAFVAGDVGDAVASPLFGLNVRDPQNPFLVNLDDETFNYFNTVSNYEFDGAELANGLTQDDEVALATNLRVDTNNVFGMPGFVKGGVKARFREKSFDVEASIFDGFDGDDDLLLSNIEGRVDFPIDTIGPVVDQDRSRGFFFQNFDLFERNDIESTAASRLSDYKAKEDIYAGYLMAQANTATGWRFTGGLRVEVTDFSAKGFNVFIEEGEFDPAVGLPAAPGLEVAAVDADFDDGEYARTSFERTTGRQTYVDALPSLNARYDINDNTVFRAAYYRSIGRPQIEQIVPTVESEFEFDGTSFEAVATVGNPDLDRQQAENFDLSVDWYLSDTGVFSAGVFYKDIDNYIAEQVFFGETFFGRIYDEAVLPVNLSKSEVNGLELSYQNAFTNLPSPFDGLLAGVTWTHVNGSADINAEDGGLRRIDLPALSENTGNLLIGYDKYGFDLRAALSYRSRYLDEINAGGEAIDRFVDEHLQLDLSAKYAVTDQFQITAELQNVTDEPFEAYFADGDNKLLSQYEEYGYTARIGVRYKY